MIGLLSTFALAQAVDDAPTQAIDKAKLYWDAASVATEDAEGEEFVNLRNVVRNKREVAAELRERMQALAKGNPELMKALVERRRLTLQLEVSKAK